jgi:large subunit ribosomal protein L13e
MVKHNNQVPNQHFHKDWKKYIKTWFDQPAKKAARRQARADKAKKVSPRPINLLRPAVRGQTNKYNGKIRAGKGFTLDELKAVGIQSKSALGVGIAVDFRRKNRSQEAFEINASDLQKMAGFMLI